MIETAIAFSESPSEQTLFIRGYEPNKLTLSAQFEFGTPEGAIAKIERHTP